MHAEALAYVARIVEEHGPFANALDIGGRDINGTPRPFFSKQYTSIDIAPGPGVDIVADARTWTGALVDVVICCEVLEHVPDPWVFIETAWRNLRPGGRVILTMACDPRAPHSGSDGGPLLENEYYGNIAPANLAEWLAEWLDVEIEFHDDRGDLYATARKPV